MEHVTPIPGHMTYGMSRDGRVWCLRTEREIKSFIHPEGYKKIHLNTKDGMKQYSVARLVAQTFIPNPDNKPEIDHINRDRADNRVENLRWATDEEQMLNTKGKGAFPKFITYYTDAHRYCGWAIQINNTTLKYKKRFNAKSYTLEQVTIERNKILTEHSIPIID